jgi:hypothetical protein
MPPVEQLFRRRHADGTTWVVLDGRLEYKDESSPLEEEDAPKRDLHLGVHAALVQRRDLAALRAWFDENPDVLRSLPGWDAQAWGESYLGEVSWAPAARVLDTGWGDDERRADGFVEESLDVAVPWHWPAGFDCSLEESLNVTLPSPQLIERGALRRERDTLIWTAEGEPVVRFVETDEGWDRDHALLGREEWLLELLDREELVFVAGSYGERRVLGADTFSSDVFGWIDLGSGALLAEREWTLRGYDVLWNRRRAGEKK